MQRHHQARHATKSGSKRAIEPAQLVVAMQNIDALAPHQGGDADEEGGIPTATFIEGDDLMSFHVQCMAYNVFFLQTPDG